MTNTTMSSNQVINNVTIPSDFICPITMEIMVHPLAARHGPNFERAAIIAWLRQGSGVCPLTRHPLCESDMIHNNYLLTEITKWRLENGVPESNTTTTAYHDEYNDGSSEDVKNLDEVDLGTMNHIYGTSALPYEKVVPAFGKKSSRRSKAGVTTAQPDSTIDINQRPASGVKGLAVFSSLRVFALHKKTPKASRAMAA